MRVLFLLFPHPLAEFEPVRHVLMHRFLVVQVVQDRGIDLLQIDGPIVGSDLLRRPGAMDEVVEHRLNPDPAAFDPNVVWRKEIEIVF